jgi:hypothetical protein
VFVGLAAWRRSVFIALTRFGFTALALIRDQRLARIGFTRWRGSDSCAGADRIHRAGADRIHRAGADRIHRAGADRIHRAGAFRIRGWSTSRLTRFGFVSGFVGLAAWRRSVFIALTRFGFTALARWRGGAVRVGGVAAGRVRHVVFVPFGFTALARCGFAAFFANLLPTEVLLGGERVVSATT